MKGNVWIEVSKINFYGKNNNLWTFKEGFLFLTNKVPSALGSAIAQVVL